MVLAADANASTQVRAIASLKLSELAKWLSAQMAGTQDEGWRAAYAYSADQIKRFQLDPKQFNLTRPTVPPDGMPIGDDGDWGGN
jgi:hypothetical protein